MKALIRIFVLLALLLLVSAVNAQFSLGLRGGVNLAKADWNVTDVDIQDNLEVAVMPYLSLIGEYRLGRNFALQAEPSFLQQGVRLAGKETSDEVTMDIDTRWEFDYLTLPVLAKGFIGQETVRGYLVAGPQAGYAIDGRVRMEMSITNGETLKEEETVDIDWDETGLSRWDFGFMFGAGIELEAGPGAVLLDARYLLGLNNLDTNEDSDGSFYQRGIGLTAGYMVRFGK